MPPLNYTTKISVADTIGEISTMLPKHGARSVSMEYDTDGRPVGVAFTLRTPHGDRSFALPVNVDGVHAMLQQHEQRGAFRAARKRAGAFSSREHAERVAWRVLRDWLEAQLAIIAAGMAQLDQVMLPYLRDDAGRTLYDRYREREQSALPAGGA